VGPERTRVRSSTVKRESGRALSFMTLSKNFDG
jgi:hypothetical protein